MARLGARIRKGTMETMETLGTAAVVRSPMSPVTNVAKAFSVPGMLQSPTVGQGLKTTNGNMVRLGDVCHILHGYAFRSEKYVCSGVRIIRIANVQKGYVEDSSPVFYPLDNNELYKYELFEDDLLMSLTGNVGRVALLQKEFLPAALNQRVACLRIKDETVIGKRFLFNFLNSDYFETKCIESSKGVAQKNMSTEWLKNYKVPLFSFEEQEKISSELDKISHLIALRKRQLSKLDELVKSRFVEMFGDVVANDRRWPMAKFGDVTDSRLGKMLDAKKQTGRNTHKYLANFNVQWFRIDDSELHEMDFDAADQIEFELKEGDLLVCEGGESGRCCVWRGQIRDCYYQKALHRVRCNPERLNPDFLAYWFWMNCHHGAFEHIIGAKATIAHLPGVKLKKLDVILPPLALQREFAAFVAKVDKLAFKAKASLEKLETFKKAMMQKYFN